jgi:steroid 5-alpha reductase family enzyme
MYWLVSLFKVFAVQELSMIVISSPIVNLMANETLLSASTFTLFDAAGIVLWSLGFYFELVADWQMTYFRDTALNKGKVLHSGLWAHCRHPNYFGETLIWWSMFFFNMNVLNGIFSIVSPLLISYILMGISAPVVEDNMLKKKIGYNLYTKSVPYYLPNLGITGLQITPVIPIASGQ